MYPTGSGGGGPSGREVRWAPKSPGSSNAGAAQWVEKGKKNQEHKDRNCNGTAHVLSLPATEPRPAPIFFLWPPWFGSVQCTRIPAARRRPTPPTRAPHLGGRSVAYAHAPPPPSAGRPAGQPFPTSPNHTRHPPRAGTTAHARCPPLASSSVDTYTHAYATHHSVHAPAERTDPSSLSPPSVPFHHPHPCELSRSSKALMMAAPARASSSG
ncbi:hypothetical protein SETIT_7G071300v2 [Setaria italica]|uniref:Uncharacterized protein n=1 Tax=Setaria italica TaxID=4555 RepID=A0A368RUP0_SETIT|nr:hypothetical protein SETIT_7G071300v2 [Setaria italica]